MATVIDGSGSAASLRFAVVQSRFNETVTKRLLAGAMEALRGGGAKDDAIEVVSVPGAFEIPLIAARLAKTRRYDAVVCLGAVIRGQTPHFEYISMVVSQGIARVAYDYGVPVIFGILTADTEELRQFVLQHLKTDAAWEDQFELKRDSATGKAARPEAK